MPRRTSLTTEARSSMVCPTEVVFCNDTLRTKGTRGMQSWIHVIEWRANVRPDLTALVDDRGRGVHLRAASRRDRTQGRGLGRTWNRARRRGGGSGQEQRGLPPARVRADARGGDAGLRQLAAVAARADRGAGPGRAEGDRRRRRIRRPGRG